MNFRDTPVEVSSHADAAVHIHFGDAREDRRNIGAIQTKTLLFKDADCLKRCQGYALCSHI